VSCKREYWVGVNEKEEENRVGIGLELVKRKKKRVG
jgi:hypothetical protein